MTGPGVRRVVLAENAEGAPIAIGPVLRDSAVERLREEIEACGWTCIGTATYLTAAAFRGQGGHL